MHEDIKKPLFQDPPLDADWITVFRGVVRDELATYDHHCRLAAIGDDQVHELGHLLGMLKDVGDGEVRKGIEAVRENQNWLVQQRERTEQFGRTLFFIVATSVIGGMVLAIWIGLKTLVTK